MGKIYKCSKNNNFIDERRFFEKYRTILKNWSIFNKLPPRLKKVLIYRYDLVNNEGNFMSYKEVSKKFKAKKQTVYLWEKKAFEILSKKESN